MFVFNGTIQARRLPALTARCFAILLVSLASHSDAGEKTFIGSLPKSVAQAATRSELRECVIPPMRILWQSETGVANAASLTQPKPGQAVLSEPSPPCELKASANQAGSVLLDFGVEIQ